MEALQTSGSRIVEPIVLDNLFLDGEAVRGADGGYLIKSQQGWEEYFAGTGKRTPTVSEYVRFIDHTHKVNRPALEGLLRDLKESALCAGTLNYEKSNLPVGSGYVDQLITDPWKNALQDEVLQYDVNEAVEVLQRASGKRPYIWTPNAAGRRSRPERAVWLVIDTDRFILNCSANPIINIGRARRVREVGAEGARAENSGSPYRTPAMTEEERLDKQVREILLPYEQLKCVATVKLYNDITENAVRELKELYKKQ